MLQANTAYCITTTNYNYTKHTIMIFSALYCETESSPSGYLYFIDKQAILSWIWKNVFQEFAHRRKKTHINFLSFRTHQFWHFKVPPAPSSF